MSLLRNSVIVGGATFLVGSAFMEIGKADSKSDIGKWPYVATFLSGALGFYLLKQNFIPVPKALELNAEGDSWDGTTGDDFRKYDDMELTEDDHETLLEEIEMGFENFPADTLRNAKASAVSQINWFGIDNAHREYDADSDNIIRFKVGEQYEHRYHHGYGFRDNEIMRRTDKTVWTSQVNPETGKVDYPLLVSQHRIYNKTTV